MKTLNSLKKFGLAMVAMTLMLTAANAQQRYKHMPRVKIDKNRVETVSTNQTKATSTTTAQMSNIEENVAANEASTPIVDNNSTVASTENVVVLETKTTSVVNHHKVVKQERNADKNVFTKSVKENSKLMDVKDVKKSNMETWLMIFIILLAVGMLFIILAIVFTFAIYTLAVLALIFYIIGALCLIAAGIILPLGLAGVI